MIDYEAASELRYNVRASLSQIPAREARLAPSQNQALLARRGFRADSAITIRDLAERLRNRHLALLNALTDFST